MDGSIIMEFQEKTQVKKVKDHLVAIDWSKLKMNKIIVSFDKI
jgi:hypothetical protein